VSGLILAGGAGRRMGGVQKGLQLLRGRPLIAWVIERFRGQVEELLISANEQIEAYRGTGFPVIEDRVRESDGSRAGPLAGLHAGLAACSKPLIATVPCDVPRLPLDLVERLHRGLAAAGADVAVASVGGRVQPVFVLARREVLAHVGAYLEHSGRRADGWYNDLNWTEVPFEDADAFANVNTLVELRGMESKDTHGQHEGH
jgi:molybdopterin-guanine dinucleotide biosynthesis protein A